MTTFSESKAPVEPRERCKAFTVVELLISSSLLVIFMSAALSSFIFISKSVAGMGNYAEMSSESRAALETVARDMRVARFLVEAGPQRATLQLPAKAGDATVTYRFNSGDGGFYRDVDDGSGVIKTSELFRGVEAFEFRYYNRLNVDVSSQASVLRETKRIQIDAKLVRKVLKVENTDYVISAQFLMRNKK
jgi:hypothetical protein